MERVEQFIVNAKKACYVGGGHRSNSSRLQSHDLRYYEGDLSYLDSYFGGTNFCGQEVVWLSSEPVWSMGYYGYITEPSLLNAEKAGQIIKAALFDLYQTHKRFLGGFTFCHPLGEYIDANSGNFRAFKGNERIECQGVVAYELFYAGGLIMP